MFRFNVSYGLMDLMTFERIERKKRAENTSTRQLVRFSFFVGILTLMFASTMINFGMFEGDALLCFLGACSLFLLLTPVWIDCMNCIIGANKVIGYNKTMTIRAENGALFVRIGGGEKTAEYPFGAFDFKCYVSQGRYVFLWYDEKYGFLTPQKTMTDGTPEAFEQWLKEECLVDIEYVW